MIGTANAKLDPLPSMDEPPPRPAQPARGPAPALSQVESSLELVIRARGGDQSAEAELFKRYFPRVKRWAHGRLPRAARGAGDSEDLAQDTLAKVLRKIPTFEPRHPGAFRDYVWTTLWNRIRDIAREYQRKGTATALDTDIPDYRPSPMEEAMGRETLDRYEGALERLRPDERKAIGLRIEMGLPYSEVAVALGKPSVAAAHMAVSRALVRLAEEMAHERKRKR